MKDVALSPESVKVALTPAIQRETTTLLLDTPLGSFAEICRCGPGVSSR